VSGVATANCSYPLFVRLDSGLLGIACLSTVGHTTIDENRVQRFYLGGLFHTMLHATADREDEIKYPVGCLRNGDLG